jgi:serine/threonine protein kinase/Tol biopolymer transport system component
VTPERLRQIEDLYHAALDNRAALDVVDPQLRQDVESLLAREGSLAALRRAVFASQIDSAPESRLAQDERPFHLSAGSMLGPYRVEGPLGAGGMGEVFRAVDTRLGRSVALKITSLQFSARFEREARAISALSHPNICTLYDVGSNYLVMELVEGESLASRLKRGALTIDLVLQYGIQIADALIEAHSKGITHRDLKPANIMIARLGVNKSGIKVLDFGLARIADETITQSNVILGTPAYMSPEQREGQAVDVRSDIYSFGLVLYEMATGRRIVSGERPQADVLPEKLAHIVQRCLELDPYDRWQTARDVKAELEWAARPAPVVASPAQVRRARWLWPSLVAVSMTVTAVLSILWLRRPASLDLSAYRYRPFAFSKETQYGGTWSPDGKNIAFIQGGHLVVQPVDGGGPTQLAERATNRLAWSPDGSRIYFMKEAYSDGVYAVSRAGGLPEPILHGPHTLGFDLSHDGKTLVVWRAPLGPDNKVRGSLWISSPPGSAPREYTPAPFAVEGEFATVVVRFSPDDKTVYLGLVSNRASGIETWLLPFPVGAGKPRRIFRNVRWMAPAAASWMPDSRRMVLASNIAPQYFPALWLADTRSESLIKIDDGSSHQSYPAVSPDGQRLLLTRWERDTDLVELPVDGSPPRNLLATSLSEYAPAWSPNGGQYGYVTDRNGTQEIRLRSVNGDWDRPIVTVNEFPKLLIMGILAISPDGQRIAYYAASEDRVNGIYVSPITGGTPTWIANGGGRSWSPDSGSLVFIWLKPGGKRVLATLRIGSNQQPSEIPLEHADDSCPQPRWSPSGEWIACSGLEGPILVSPDGKVQRSLAPGKSRVVAWSKDSRTLYGVMKVNGRTSLNAWDVRSGVVRKVADYAPDFTLYNTPDITLNLSPDGKSFATATVKDRMDLWILEGFAK